MAWVLSWCPLVAKSCPIGLLRLPTVCTLQFNFLLVAAHIYLLLVVQYMHPDASVMLNSDLYVQTEILLYIFFPLPSE